MYSYVEEQIKDTILPLFCENSYTLKILLQRLNNYVKPDLRVFKDVGSTIEVVLPIEVKVECD